MATIRCPSCGSPVMLRGKRWECGWCGDFGELSSLSRSDKAKLARAVNSTIPVKITVTVTDDSHSEDKKGKVFDQKALEDMVKRWDFSENEWACRDLLIAAFPQAVKPWTPEELSEMDTMDLLVETGERDPDTAVQMIKLLLDTAEEHLQTPAAARQLLGYEMYDVLMDENVLPPLVQQLKEDDRLAFQLFCSAYAGRPQEKILQACGRLGESELQKELLELLEINPFPHDPVEIQ